MAAVELMVARSNKLHQAQASETEYPAAYARIVEHPS
jgi:hypothetical protein